ncbi:MAG: histidine phosphatase family protein [Fenollaria massiliensis]|uniref:histidine phosphatase family protein n=1 Tax=Fenollaria massiliensis TaxID=938288 RepID=UPI00036DDF3A|nr:histidine phosphatase family protein [Fenollaria massiliensis]AVM66942.1 histidine phosphatase family protein [Peptostreptococcaceae bacterium oral taxon 929]
MKIYFTRHGLTEYNKERRIQGLLDSPLTLEGKEKAKELGARLKDEGIEIIYSSDQKRAMDSAKIINEALKLDIIPDRRLREVSMLSHEGMTWAESVATDPDREDLIMQRPDLFNEGGIYPYRDALEDAIAFIFELIKTNYEKVLVMTHGSKLRVITTVLEGLDLKDTNKVELIKGLSLKIYDYNEGKFKLLHDDEDYDNFV